MSGRITEKVAERLILEHLKRHGYPGISLANTEHPVERLGGGYCRDCYKVYTNNGKFVITFFTFNWQSQTVDFINDFVNHLNSSSCSIVPVIGHFGRTDQNTAFEVMPFVEGHVVKDPNNLQIQKLGAELGKIHKASCAFKCDANSSNQGSFWGWVRLGTHHGSKILAGSEYVGTSYFKGDIPDVMRNSVAVMESLLQRKKLPQGIIHGDMNRHNVLWQENAPVLLDFERTRPSDFLYEVAKTIQEFIVIPSLEKGRTDYKEKINTFLNAYHEERPFTEQEIETLPTMLRLHAVLVAVKQSAMGMGRRYPALPQGVMLQNEANNLAAIDFKSILKTPVVSDDYYKAATPATSRSL